VKQSRWLLGVAVALALVGCATRPQASSQEPSTGKTAAGSAAATASISTGQPTTRRTADQGKVVGIFLREGGPLGPGLHQPALEPLWGTVQFTPRHGQAIAVRVGSSGLFAVWLPAGRYVVSGRTSLIVEQLPSGAQRDAPCSLPLSVTVEPGRTVRIAVTCAVP